MKTLVIKIALMLACSCAYAGEAASKPAPRPDELTITVLHVNDVHGQTQSRNGRGGYARLATAVQDIRKDSKSGQVLLLHAGDEISRGDGLTQATGGAANIGLMNALAFDAFTPGNGEFYAGQSHLSRLMERAKFPFLLANIKPFGRKQLGKPYVILNSGAAKVAVVGLCFVRKELPSAWGLEVADPIETARKLLPELRQQADVVIVLSHIGLGLDQELAKAVEGIDLIIGGHSHSLIATTRIFKGSQKNAVVCQAGQYLEHLGRITIKLNRDGDGYKIRTMKAEMIKLDQKVPEDAGVKAHIARLAAATQPARPLQPAR